jgi:mRNA interferase MazF
MPSYFRSEVILVQYPFTDLSATKVRPAVVVHAPHLSVDLFIVPLTSQTGSLAAGEFVLADWRATGLHIATAAKRGIFTIHPRLVVKQIGQLSVADLQRLEQSLRT